MLYFAYFLLYAFIFLFGSCVFSFLNVVIYRVPLGISVAKGRSFCPSCGEVLKPCDMIPVVSFFALHGKCRFCGGKISRRYPLVEALGGLAALLIYLRFGFTPGFLIYFTASAVLAAISFIDYATMEIPNGLIIALIIPAIASAFLTASPTLIARVIGAFCVSVPMLLLTLFIPQCFGGGDIKLMAVCGFMLGWQGILLAGFIALLLGGAHGVVLLRRSAANGKAHFPFGQYLCIGVFIALLYGGFIIKIYLHLFGL